MKLYSARVRLAGSRDHEVTRHNLTPAEMKLLEFIHVSAQGHPTLVDIEHTGSVNRSDAKERARLVAMEYSHGELEEDRGEKLLTRIFGLPGVPLPQEYVPPTPVEAVEYDPEEDEAEEVITPVEPVVRTRASRRREEAAA